jgi:hypothetical protein
MPRILDVKHSNNGQQQHAEPDGLFVSPEDEGIGADTGNEQQCRQLTVGEIVTDFTNLGIVGESDMLLAIYFIGTSRLLNQPLSAIVQGGSSTGKSYTIAKVGRLFPPDHVIIATRMSPQALYHMSSVANKFVIAGERSRVQDDSGADATAALRQLQSEGRITKYVTERNGDRFVTNKYEVVGPISYVETTTLDLEKIFPEDLNRALVLNTDEGEEQTRAILRRQANRYTETQQPEVESVVEKHRQFQSSLQRRTITIPFAERLIEALPAGKVEMRRIGQQVLSMIEAVTLLHQHMRQTDEHGRLVATADDYKIAARVLRQPLASSSLGVSDGAVELHASLLRNYSTGDIFPTTEVQTIAMGNDERTVRLWLSALHCQGCLDQVEKGGGRGKPTKWRLTGKAPTNELLPNPQAIGLGG